jgi:membrane peptidoglycan carboxypeptidase
MRILVRLLCAILLAGFGLAAGVVLLAPQVRDFFTAGDAGPHKDIDLQPLATRSVVYARDGSILTQFHAEENRVPIGLDKVPPHVVRAVLDAEDDRFFDHGPLDIRAITRALVTNVESGGVLQGGSTITQQLVKTAILSPRQDVNRKVQEAALAIRLEGQMSKREILERYMNTVYFGNGAYGIEAAAEKYYATDTEHLTLGQGVLLASLIRNPAGGDPWVNPDEAIARRLVVIERMHELGHITAEEAEALKAEPLPPPAPERPAQGSDYFVEHVKQILLDDERLGATPQDRIQAVFKGGLQIHTTLDPGLQAIAEQKVASIVPDTAGQFGAALVSVEPSTGGVRALVGGTGFDVSKYNLVTDPPGRQTGSSFKPFTLIAALEAGYIPSDTINGAAPCRIPDPESVEKVWEAKNVEGEGGGVMTLTSATVSSVNCAYARLIKLLGPAKVAEVAKRMGIAESLEPPILSLTLGAKDVTPLSMAAAYATLAADGERRNPVFIDWVADSQGKVLIKADPKPERAISVQNARTTTQILTQVVNDGTGQAAFIPGWSGGVAGKTGSADNNLNAWFVGYTHELSTAVWMGSLGTVQRPMTNVGGVTVYGGTYPAQIWGAYMRDVVTGKTPVRFPAPDVVNTRAPRQLVLAGELPVFEERVVSRSSGSSDDNGGGGGGSTRTVPANDTPATTTRDDRNTVRAPTTFEVPGGRGNTDDDDDNTPRTSRVRPRDLTTLPGDE